MRSSTSSSDRIPDGPWLRTWGLALLTAVVLLALLEGFWRDRGHRPSAVDDVELWAWHRRGVYADGAVVLVGASRMLMDFDTATFRARFPDRPLVGLAVEGAPPIATLRDLAEDEAFRGTVICSAVAHVFERSERDRQLGHVRHFHENARLNDMLNARLASLAQGSFAFAHPQVRLSETVLALIRRRPLPEPLYVVTRTDRSKAADYGLIHIESHRARRIERRTRAYRERAIPAPDAWRAEVADLRPWVDAIRSRGGEVVFVRFPTSDEHWDLDESYYPRTSYWDRVGEATGAPTVHFADHGGLSGFDCPDTSHLDQRDAPRFTSALLDVLVDMGILGSGTPAGPPPRGPR